jgi:hypothetical protein
VELEVGLYWIVYYFFNFFWHCPKRKSSQKQRSVCIHSGCFSLEVESHPEGPPLINLNWFPLSSLFKIDHAVFLTTGGIGILDWIKRLNFVLPCLDWWVTTSFRGILVYDFDIWDSRHVLEHLLQEWVFYHSWTDFLVVDNW